MTSFRCGRRKLRLRMRRGKVLLKHQCPLPWERRRTLEGVLVASLLSGTDQTSAPTLADSPRGLFSTYRVGHPCSPVSPQSPSPEIHEELLDGDTRSICPSEGPMHHTATEGQHRLLLNVAAEGSPESGPRGEQERRWARTPPRLLPRVLSWAHREHNTSAPTWNTVSAFP